MKNLLFTLVLLFSLTSYSQEKRIESINKVNDTITLNGYVYESTDFPKVVVIKTDTETLRFENVVPGDEMDDYYSLYSNDDSFRFDIYQCKVIVYTINPDKTAYIKLYNIELK